MLYQCAKCGKPVTVLQGVPFRDCHCPADTPIAAQMRSALEGRGGVKTK